MQHAMTPDFDVGSLARLAGPSAFAKGFQYAQQRAVVHVEWDEPESRLRGLVRGSGGNLYSTAVYFSGSSGQVGDVELAECTCPVEFNCKHAVALVLTVVMAVAPGELCAEPPASSPVSWERSLDSLLLTSGPDAAAAARQATTPLAIELTLARLQELGRPSDPAAGPLRLLGRLVRSGRNGGWVNGGLSWGKLESLNYNGNYAD